MLHINDIKIRPKLIFAFILTGIIPLAIAGLFGLDLASKALMEKSFDQLASVQDIRKTQVESLIRERMADLKHLANSKRVVDLAREINVYSRNQGTSATGRFSTNTPEYRQATLPYRTALRQFVDSYRFYDMLLITPNTGQVAYSVLKQSDLGTSLIHGEFQDSGLARVWRKVIKKKAMAVEDFAPYSPSGGIQSAFIGYPVSNNFGQMIGVAILQLGPNFANHIMDSRRGMGETGESYLLNLNENTGRFSLRSNILSMGNGQYKVGFELPRVLNYWKNAQKKGYEGGQGLYFDSAGNAVLATYNRLNLRGLHWYLISKIDKHEVTAPIRMILQNATVVAAFLIMLIAGISYYLGRTISRPLLAGVSFAHDISEGKLDAALDYDQKDEIGQLSSALNRMARKLREADWMQSGKEGLDDSMRGENDTDELARHFIAFATKHMNAELGAVYLVKNDTLHLKASYCFTDRQGNFNRIPLGEGMVGQAALEREILTFSHAQEDAPVFNYGAGETTPAHFMVVPLEFEGELLGAVLIGSQHRFTELQKQFVLANKENTAILFNVAQSRETISKLLEQAQEQQEELRATNEELEEQAKALKESEAELQAQQEELRVTNEELEEQTKALKESQTELQAQQEELRVTNEELEERTEALERQKDAIRKKNGELVKAQDAIRQKAKDLELASKYKSEFLANMSHELRTPLNSILILSQLLSKNTDANLSDKQVESAKAIHSSGSDLLKLINEILDLSKVEAGKVELFVEPAPLELLIADLNRVFRDVAEEKGLDFNVNLAPDLPESLHTDSQRLQQILRNLLTNAFKFTNEGAVTLDITRPSQGMVEGRPYTEDAAIAFAVTDQGIGIPQKQQAAIFEAFQQADGSTSRRYGGTGLGLSISRELTKLLGGTIHLESTEGSGSTFTIVLPENEIPREQEETAEQVQPASEVKQQPVSEGKSAFEQADKQEGKDRPTRIREPEAPESAPSAPAEQTPVEFLKDDRKSISENDRTLLIIEDDERFAKVMRDFAHEHDFKCLVAEDGETGLHFADYYKPSAIVLDIGLPGIDGWTVMERLKENPKLRHIPVHFMSGHDSSLDAMRMGAVGYMTKPVSMEKIETAFAKLEGILAKPMSKLLVVEDDDIQRESIRQLIGNGDVETTTVATGKKAFRELETGTYDCMVLDLGLQDMSGFELLEQIRNSTTCSTIPVIIYTGRELTREEDEELRKYTESIIIKGAKSPERLLEETALFLHRVESNLPEDKQRMLKMVHDKESVLAGKTVLLVDDDMRNVFALSSVLQEKGMNTVIARNGAESIEKLNENGKGIDLVLMDIMMPQMDGYEAMHRIRKQSEFKRLPIIALTAKAMKGDRSKCIEAGANDYLAKPVNTDKLISMLRVWLYS